MCRPLRALFILVTVSLLGTQVLNWGQANHDAMSALTLRSYQRDCVGRALNGNSIISLGTGKGKTLVAVKVIDHFLPQKDKHVLFAVPTKVLVSQQAKYCENHCDPRPSVAQLSGPETDHWDELKWDACLNRHQVVVATPEIFRRAMDKGFMSASKVSLLVLDECHNAKGNSPMAQIMRCFVKKLPADQRPRVLGLTASYASGRLRRKADAENQRLQLELLLDASIFSPDTPDENSLGAEEAEKRTWTSVSWRQDQQEVAHAAAFQEQVLPTLRQLADKLGGTDELHKDLQKIGNSMHHVLEQLGSHGLQDYVREGTLKEFECKIQDLENYATDPALKAEFQQYQQVLRSALQNMAPVLEQLASASPTASSKLLHLEALLQKEPQSSGKGIIFVERVAMTLPLVKALRRDLGPSFAEAIWGQMTQSDQSRTLQKFRDGEIKVIVATNALEEGIDVCDCNFIVRYDWFATTKSHVQGAGRARERAAQIFYFLNDVEEEASKAKVMDGVAKDDELALSPTEREILEGQGKEKEVPNVYPYVDGQRIDLHNCLSIVMEWCQQVLKEEFEQSRLFPDGETARVQIPTPDGFKVITAEDIDRHWQGVSLRDIIPKQQLAGWSAAEQRKRRALFVAACFLRKQGLVDAQNTASTKKRALAESACCTGPATKKLRFNGAFQRSNIEVTLSNPKGALQELLQQQNRRVQNPQELLDYQGRMESDGTWVITLQVKTLTGKVMSQASARSKKQAEQEAARKAYQKLTEGA